jgi:TrmH family RNA methyltransferase
VITSVDNPRVKDVLQLRKSRERRRLGLFIAEGPREVERAIAAGLVVREIFYAPDLLPAWTPQAAPGRRDETQDEKADEKAAIVTDLRRAGHPANSDRGPARPSDAAAIVTEVRPQEVSTRVLAKLSYRAEPEGLIAVVEAPRRELPPDATLILVAVGIEKPGNLGAMARTADAAGADALLVADAASDPWNPNAIRASTGAVFTLPVIAATRAEVAQLPHRRIAAVVDAPTLHTAADYTGPTAILVGAEDAGLDREWQALAQECVAIPMHGRTADSLNASVAAAVLLFEAVRQRDARG